jgi:hypothetical protein
MASFRRNLLSTAAMLAAGGVLVAASALPGGPAQATPNPQGVTQALAVNPEAVTRLAASCTPCAAKKICNPCNPCAATKVNAACNPCAAKKN